MTSWPLSKAEWIRWLDQEQAADENALQLAKVGARRAVNVRAASGCPAEGSSDCVIFVVPCAGKFAAFAQALVVVHSEGIRRQQYMCTRSSPEKSGKYTQQPA